MALLCSLMAEEPSWSGGSESKPVVVEEKLEEEQEKLEEEEAGNWHLMFPVSSLIWNETPEWRLRLLSEVGEAETDLNISNSVDLMDSCGLKSERKQYHKLVSSSRELVSFDPPNTQLKVGTRVIERQRMDYLEKEDDVPDESQDDGRVSVCNISCVDTDQLHLSNTQQCDSDCAQDQYINQRTRRTHVPLLQKGQNLGDVVESEDTVGGLLEAVQLKQSRTEA